MKVIVYSNKDGTASIIYPAPSHRRITPRDGAPPALEPEAEWLQRVAEASVPHDAHDAHVIDQSDLPEDETFRNAWRHSAGSIHVDMTEARSIHRDAMRRARGPLLDALDVEYQRAHEADDKEKMRQVVEGKKLLRDVTDHPGIDQAQTPEELKAIWPFDRPTPRPSPPVQVAPVIQPVPMPQDDRDPGWVGRVLDRIDDVPLPAPVLPQPAMFSEPAPEPDPPYHLPEVSPPVVYLDDSARRRAAKARVRNVAAGFAFNSSNEQLRYEHALMAHNGNVSAIEMFADEARTAGLSVQQLSERIVNERTVNARRMMNVRRIHDRALSDLDKAAGDQIAAVEQQAIAEMNGETSDHSG